MGSNSIDLNVGLAPAVAALERLERDVEPSAAAAVSQLAVLAENAMKEEGPEGAGHDKHLRETVGYETDRSGLRATVYPDKKTNEGWLLARAIVGDPSTPTYGEDVPVWTDGDGNAQGPLARWAAAKLGNANAAWPISQSWKGGGGQDSFPNPFVARAAEKWERRTDELFGESFFDAMGVD